MEGEKMHLFFKSVRVVSMCVCVCVKVKSSFD